MLNGENIKMKMKKAFKKLVQELDKISSLGKEGLLKSEEMYKVIHKVEDELEEISKTLDKRSCSVIEKVIPKFRVRNEPLIGIFIESDEIEKKVFPLKDLLLKLLSEQSGHAIVNLKEEIVITKGKEYEGRSYFRKIIEQASKSIFIRDSYFTPIVLDILLEYLFENNNLKVEIMMGDNNKLIPFRVHYASFKSQYPNFNASARYSVGQDIDHPRYILIDDQLLFNPDHSIDQWGKKTVNVHRLSDGKEIIKAKAQLFSEWNIATNL